MNDYKGRLLKKSSNRKSKLVLSTLVTTWLSNVAFHLRLILLQTLVAIKSESCCSMPDIVSKLLRATIWSRCAVLFKSEQTPFFRTGRLFGSAALHRTGLGTCRFVPLSYFYSETNDWSKDWAKRRDRLWSATNSRQFHRKFYIAWREKKWPRCGPKFTDH